MSSQRPATRTKRIKLYLREQFPPLLQVPVALLSFSAGYLILFSQPTITANSLLGALTVFSLLLTLRLSDELKDELADREYFPERALPRGAVDQDDLKALLSACLLVIITANAWLPAPRLWVFFVLVPYTLLMRHWFFLRKYIAGNLLLALATHNPIVPVITVYVYLLALQDGAKALSGLHFSLFIAAFWLPSLAWELGRKIRAPNAEDRYQTYSRILGTKLACLSVLLAQAGAIALLFILRVSLSVPMGTFFFLGIAWSASALAQRRFLRTLPEGPAPLRSAVELFLLSWSVILVIATLWDRGLGCGLFRLGAR